MLGAGLAAVGEGADVGVAALSAEAVPVCGEEPAEAPLTLFCRGERGLWAAGEQEKGDAWKQTRTQNKGTDQKHSLRNEMSNLR